MHKPFIIFLFSFLFLTIQAQEHKEQLIKRVCDALLLDQTGSLDENCIRDEDSGMILSCFEIMSKPEWVSDFDGDGQEDVLAYFMDEGLGGGGNAFGYEYKLVLIKDNSISDILTLFGGGKLSYAFLEVDSVRNNKIYASYNENPMARKNFGDESDLRSIKLEFEYRDGKLMEKSYLRCPIADMDKRIFKESTIYGVERTLSSNDLYEMEQYERLLLNPTDQTDQISATLSGCENIYLRFSYNMPYSGSDYSGESVKKQILVFLSTLEENTRYLSTIKLLSEKIKSAEKLNSGEYNIIDHTFTLTNSWKASVLAYKLEADDKNFLSLIVNFTKYDSKKPDDFWSNIERK